MDKKNIRYKKKYWPDTLISCFQASYENGKFLFDNKLGKGTIAVRTIINGLHVAIIDAQLLPSQQLTKVHFLEAAQYSLIFILPGSHLTHPDLSQTDATSAHFAENHVYFISSKTAISIYTDQSTVLKALFITFSQEWLNDYLDQILIKEKKLIRHIIYSNEPILRYRQMTFPIQQLAETIASINWKQPFISVFANAKILEILFILLAALSARKDTIQKIVNQHDYEQIQNIINILSENWQKKCPSIKEMAQLVHMSPSKFKKLFKAVYEKPYYTFFLHLKLLRCMELLKTGKLSVTEVAYMAGYSSPSKFSEIFKQHFNIRPSSIVEKR